ncbi:transporter substrate-binding domain-containing protein [Pseudorhodobacter turbinis]|uniref:Transporter substrate-binding domain-containing protein n=1 Tax=Pseudorhodobacter turbinis TaxID=2500533 RepID=A0A4P8EEF1_9RHOB|nr:transporter substrate-binding domain-containing protein [Pseudorhodobacter turbinis]QCO55431.1 transporter substrate-binding domain-containing protein [Pseudorhodobacter turbinis]
MNFIQTTIKKSLGFILGATMAATTAQAGPLEDRVEAGEPIRLGFAAAPPWAYAGDDGAAKGFVNDITIDVLKRMGHTDVEPVLTDWAGLIPSLNASRVDIVTGGMYVLAARCANMDFSEPIGVFGDAFVVPAGNPKGVSTYQDIIDQDLIMVSPSGYNTIADAKAAGVPTGNIMEVPGTTEMLAAIRAGRADAGATNALEAQRVADMSDAVEMTDPLAFPPESRTPVAVGFHTDDDAFREAFNAALAEYLGSDEMMAKVAQENYIPAFLPDGQTTAEACKAN